jgi:hypothetical protein
MDVATLFYLTGPFAILLGGLHFFFPMLFDFEHAIPKDGPALKPFRLWRIRYGTTRQDVRGIAWVMNHFVSYNLVAYGVIDLLWRTWLSGPLGVWVCVWLAGGWFVRAAAQLYLGRRLGDWLILAGFALIGLIHVLVAITR